MSPERGPELVPIEHNIVANPAETTEKGGEEAVASVYLNSDWMKLKRSQVVSGQPFAILATDIDHTFHRSDRIEKMNTLFDESNLRDVPIMAVTGNWFPGVMRRIESGELPYFQVIASSVGTEIWVLQTDSDGDKRYLRDETFRKKLLESGFDRFELARKARDMAETIQAKSPEWRLEFQKEVDEANYLNGGKLPEGQEFKISFHFFVKTSDLTEVVESVSAFFPDQEIIACGEIGYNSKLSENEAVHKFCLDIVPVTKAGAVNYISKVTGVERGIVAGDSGNDIDMLINSEKMTAVLVGGAKSEAVAGIDKATVVGSKKGTRFRRVLDDNGQIKACYVEKDDNALLGPESIIKAVEILNRAANIQRIKEQQNQ